jgi:hypothetical protein
MNLQQDQTSAKSPQVTAAREGERQAGAVQALGSALEGE